MILINTQKETLMSSVLSALKKSTPSTCLLTKHISLLFTENLQTYSIWECYEICVSEMLLALNFNSSTQYIYAYIKVSNSYDLYIELCINKLIQEMYFDVNSLSLLKNLQGVNNLEVVLGNNNEQSVITITLQLNIQVLSMLSIKYNLNHYYLNYLGLISYLLKTSRNINDKQTLTNMLNGHSILYKG